MGPDAIKPLQYFTGKILKNARISNQKDISLRPRTNKRASRFRLGIKQNQRSNSSFNTEGGFRIGIHHKIVKTTLENS